MECFDYSDYSGNSFTTISSLTSSTYSSSLSSSSASNSELETCASNVIMACCVAFVACSGNELSIDFADRVKVLEWSLDWCLVQNVLTGKCGYVPADSICPIDQFLNDIEYLKRK
jgi:hypothetical protein